LDGDDKYTILFFGVSVIPGIESRLYIYVGATIPNLE
jgi:hypothetical protein